MNTNTSKNNQASQKADRMAGNGQRTRTGREDSTMQSEQSDNQPHQSPMRVAASRPDSHEFKVAGEVYGGSMRQKNQPSKSGPITDDKGFVLPLDSAVAKEMVAGRKEQEPVNHLHQALEHNVRVGLNKPSLTVFSSMGGGRNGSSTKIEFGGASNKKAAGNGTPKEFEYRDEDFQPLSAQGNAKQRISKGASSTGQNAAHSSRSLANKPGTSLEESRRQQAGHRSQRDVSPELTLGALFQDEQQGGSRASSKQSSALPIRKHAAPTHQKGKLSHASSRAAAPAPAVAFPSTNLRKDASDRKQDHTPEMNLGSLFQEEEASSQLRSNQQQQQQQAKATPRFQRFGVSNGHQDFPEQSSSSRSAVVPPYHASYGPNRHVQHAVPIHKSAMPPVHHASPAHHPAPEHGFTAAHQASEHQSAPNAHAHDDPMHHSNAAPVYHAPSASSGSHGGTRVEVIHEPSRAFASGLQSSSVGVHNLQHAANATPDSAPAPTHEIPFTKHKPVQVLGKSREEPIIAQQHVQDNVAHMQTEAAGLNAASYPSFVRHPAESDLHPASTRSTAKSGRNLNQEKREVHPAHPKRMSKRERKAARRSEAAKHMSVLDSISSALVGRRKNSVSTPVMRLNELFEPSEQWEPQTEEHHPSTAVAAGLGGIRSMLGSMHMPALITRQPSDAKALHAQGSFKLGAASSHAYGTASQSRQKPIPSKAAALKAPRINLALYPEEQPDYSRGINIKRENPRPAKVSAHVRNITEIPYRGSSASGHNTRSTVASAGVRGPPLAHMILDLHARHAGPFKAQSQSATASTTVRARNQQTRHSTAAALKTPKLNLSLFPEEEAGYPRGEGLHRSNRPATHANVVEVKEIQLDSAHRHAHHDLHPTIAETATTAVNQGIAGLKSMWGSLHAPTSDASEGGAINNPAAAAVLSTMAAAAMHHVPSAPEVHRAPNQSLNSDLTTANNLHLDASREQQHRDPSVKSKKPDASHLPLMYGTPVHSSASSHHHAPPVPPKHEQHHATSGAYMASMMHSGAAPATHAAPASSSVYSAEPAAQYHSVAPKIVSVPGQGYSSHRTAAASAAVPLAAAAGSIQANSLHQQQHHQPHQQQRNHRFTASEHHARCMEIHATTEDAEERFFPAQDWQSPAVRQTPMMSTKGAALKPKDDPALLLARRTAPMSVLPSPSHSNKGIMIAGPAQHAQQHQQQHQPQQNASSGINSASLPLAAAAGVGVAAASHGLHQHQQQAPKNVPVSKIQAPKNVPVAKIPIAEPPVQVPVRPHRVPIAQPPATSSSSHRQPGMNTEASAVRSTGSRIPGQHIRSRLSHDSSTSEAALAAAPLMAASAMAVKSDNVLMMESDNSHPTEHQGDRKHQHRHHQQEPMTGALPRDAHAHGHDDQSVGSATRVAPVSGQHQSHQHHTGAAMAGAAVPILNAAPRTALPAMNATHAGQPALGRGENIVMMKTTTTTTSAPVVDPLATSGPAASVAPLRAGEPVVIPTQRAGEDVVIQTRTIPKGSEAEHRPLQQQAVPKQQQQQQPMKQSHLKEATIIPTQRAGEDIIVQARTVPADTKSATHSSPHLQDSHKPSHHYGTQALGASAAATAAMPIHHNSFDRSSVEGTKGAMGSGAIGATHASRSSHRDTPIISNVAAPTAQSILASSASFDPAANSNAGTVKPAPMAVHTPASPQYQHAAVHNGEGTTVGTPSAAAVHSTHFPVPAPRPAAFNSTSAAAGAAATAAAVPIVAASALHRDVHGSNHVDTATTDRQGIDHQRHATTSVSTAPNVNHSYNGHSATSGVTPVTTIHSQSIQPTAAHEPHVGALETCPIAHSHAQYHQPSGLYTATTTSASAPVVSAATGATAAAAVCPPGYDGPVPAVNPGEKVLWVKKVRTTQEYYESDEEDGDELDLDEFGYRRDRDVSLHMPVKTGTNGQPVSRSGSVSGSIGSTELRQLQETNAASATRRGLAQ
ncbi:hypothetical protein KVV02_002275 [Mortierella alpina]|uniref:Uncharacterized protein n=1 Tax=Mortierella alpina TaxID=64518 RepID=A0A9P8A5V9_MORAP|nr:hypothetical protein KVV02_002275 [Mortierella alpina]